MGIIHLNTPEFEHNSSLRFSGTSSFLQNSTNSTLGYANVWTFACWVKSAHSTIANQLFAIRSVASAANQIFIRREGVAGHLGVQINNSAGTNFKNYTYGTTTTQGPVCASDWNHIVLTWNGTTLQLYWNGIATAPTTSSVDNAGTMTDSSRYVTIGATHLDGSQWSGTIHSVGMWNVALTQEEVTKLYSGYNQIDWRKIQGGNLQHYWVLGKDDRVCQDLGLQPIDLETNKGVGITTANIVNDAPTDRVVARLGPTGHKWSLSLSASYLQNSSTSNSGVLNTENAWTWMYWFKTLETNFTTTRNHLNVNGTSLNAFNIQHLGSLAGDPYEVQWRSSAAALTKLYRWNNMIVGDTWTQVIVTWDGSSMLLYHNGILVSPTSTTTDNAGIQSNSLRSVTIGATGGGTTFINALVHSVAIWAKPATQQDVTTLYNDGNGFNLDCNFAPLSIERPVHWWLLGEPDILVQDRIARVPNEGPIIGLLDNLAGGVTNSDSVADYPRT